MDTKLLTMEICKVSGMQRMGFLLLYFLLIIGTTPVFAKTRYYDFVIKETPYTRLCETKHILTVNDQFPGPAIHALKGDRLIVRVLNHGDHNVTLHWHGVDMPRNPWSDGPEFVTQCGIQPGANFTYTVQLSSEEGTLWWHAHSDWTRATVHGAIIIHPKPGTTFPFRKPHKEIPIILGEWWKSNVRDVLAQALLTGGEPNVSDAFTINGQPGDLLPCSKPETFTARVEPGKTYLLRVVNAAVNTNVFFAIAGHHLTVVGTDGSYTKPFTMDYIMITPGQTMDLLLVADANSTNNRFYMAARSFSSGLGVHFDNSTATGIVEYVDASTKNSSDATPEMTYIPINDDDEAALAFTANLRSLASAEHPADVPRDIDQRLIMTVSMNVLPCKPTDSCVVANGTVRFAASMNNVTFVDPKVDVLEAYYRQLKGVYGDGFPKDPPSYYNFTGAFSNDTRYVISRPATEVRVVEYGTVLEVVFQGTNLVAPEDHPMHLHGQSFYVVGMGAGNFDAAKDPKTYNLMDPPKQNTVSVPKNGWAAIRFKANNPGVWFMHCHLDRHSTWGMNTVFIVKNGAGKDAQMLPPPANMPPC